MPGWEQNLTKPLDEFLNEQGYRGKIVSMSMLGNLKQKS